MKYWYYIVTILFVAGGPLYAQQPQKDSAAKKFERWYVSFPNTDVTDTVNERMLFSGSFPVRSICKKNNAANYLITRRLPVQRIPTAPLSVLPAKKPILQVHGNILYDVNYRSYIDTPYADKDVYQHTVQTYLDITYKDRLPFRIYLTNRFSNSSWFRNFSDINLQYNVNDYKNKIRRQVINQLERRVEADSLLKLKNTLTGYEKEYQEMRTWLSDAGSIQRIVSEREHQWFKTQWKNKIQKPTLPDSLQAPNLEQINQGSFNKYKFPDRRFSKEDLLSRLKKPDTSAVNDRFDSLKNNLDTPSLYARYDSVKKKMDTLDSKITVLKKKYQELKAFQDLNTTSLKKEIAQLNSGSALKEKLKTLHVADSTLPKGYQTLFSIRSFGLGRTMLDYSELSAKNVSINGLQVEYNPSKYMAVAAGWVDYRFRSYTIQNAPRGQYIGLVRYGWGMKEGNHLYLTYYTGKRQLYNTYTTTQGADIPNYKLMGFTVEGRYKVGRTSAFTAEVARSSAPYYSLDSNNRHNVLGSVLKVNDHSNEAWSVKFNTFIPNTQTQFDAGYSRYGANFQSFSLFTSGSQQTAWYAKVMQPFFHRQLQVTGSVRTNDFTNPLLNTSYKSSTVFKSIQATLRLRKWPTLSVGYYPSAQIIKLDDDHYQENLFYTFTASAGYVYQVHEISMISMAMYTQFYNKIADSNFVYFNTKNLLLSQTAIIGRLNVQTQLSAAQNNSYNLYVLDGRGDYKINNWLSLGAGIKYNRQTVYNVTQWGYSGSAGIKIPKLGDVKLTADKGFIPGNNRQLVPNNVGRLTYFKTF